MAYTDIDNPTDYFNTVLYTGNSGTQAIAVGFQSDWVWCKPRGNTGSHFLTDSVRGGTEVFFSNTSAAAITRSNNITGFTSTGYTLGADGTSNYNGDATVSWNWKAGTSFSNSAGANGASIASTGSVNATAGFSIISYTGSGSNATVAHGLGSVPKMIIVKSRSGAVNWQVYHSSIANTEALELNGVGPKYTAANRWNSTSTTSSVFSIGTSTETNASSATFIAYCFADVKGYSKFGSYTGNGNANGAFIYTGFQPAWIMIKAIDQDGEGWFMFDNKRDVDNAVDKHLIGNANGAEASGSHAMDFVSNGIKIRNGGDGTNTNNKNYVYLAFAEQPFTTSTGVPATAR